LGIGGNSWNPQSLTAFNQAFEDAALLGITVCAASGDNGSSDGSEDGAPNVDFPASSPYVLACGGTSLIASNDTIASETVWNDSPADSATGGGISSFFPVPAYQSAVKLPPDAGGSSFRGCGVPDVAGVADPNTGYFTLVDGSWGVVGGTSSVAPMWLASSPCSTKSLANRLATCTRLSTQLRYHARRCVTSLRETMAVITLLLAGMPARA
jgi:kumamolisin